jgi:hypothetical protein
MVVKGRMWITGTIMKNLTSHRIQPLLYDFPAPRGIYREAERTAAPIENQAQGCPADGNALLGCLSDTKAQVSMVQRLKVKAPGLTGR